MVAMVVVGWKLELATGGWCLLLVGGGCGPCGGGVLMVEVK